MSISPGDYYAGNIPDIDDGQYWEDDGDFTVGVSFEGSDPVTMAINGSPYLLLSDDEFAELSRAVKDYENRWAKPVEPVTIMLYGEDREIISSG